MPSEIPSEVTNPVAESQSQLTEPVTPVSYKNRILIFLEIA